MSVRSLVGDFDRLLQVLGLGFPTLASPCIHINSFAYPGVVMTFDLYIPCTKIPSFFPSTWFFQSDLIQYIPRLCRFNNVRIVCKHIGLYRASHHTT